MFLHKEGKFLLVAGPCALESMEICRAACQVLEGLKAEHSELNILFSGSFDKANRTSLSSPRGPGLTAGLEMLQMVKEEYGFPISTDIHLPEQADEVAKVADVLQIPAFLCRQTDLIVAAAETGRTVSVKKGQFMSPYEMQYVVQKLEASDAHEIWLIERGNTFGYQNLIVDMRSFPILKGYNYPVIFDATHSVQLPGAGGGKTSGQRQFVATLAHAACAAGADGLYIETHPNPAEAISDSGSQLPFDEFVALVKKCLKFYKLVKD